MLPKNGFREATPRQRRTMLAVTHFAIQRNIFTGMLPESGFREVARFYIYMNGFTGVLPDGGMRTMQALI
eukprot:405117-Amphidinium_carterae.1